MKEKLLATPPGSLERLVAYDEAREAGADPCLYCGTDNGPVDPQTGRGICRFGFDCYLCGGN